MLLFVPGAPGHYFDTNVMFYGIAPIVLSGLLFATVGVLSARWNGSRRIARSIADTIAYGIAAVVFFYVAMGIVSMLQRG